MKDLVGDTVLFDGPGPKGFAFFYISFMVAYKTLADEGLLGDLEYQSLGETANYKLKTKLSEILRFSCLRLALC